MKFHPLSEPYPLMEGEAYDLLREDIRRHGLNEPIVRYQGAILDGRNRYRACKDSGTVLRFADFKGTEAEAAAFVESANEHRRHLTADWLAQKRQERIARVVESRQQGNSLRVIAEQEGVSLGQIQRDIKEAGVSGDTPEPVNGTVTGRDGKQQPARKRQPAQVYPPDTPEPEANGEAESKDEATDEIGVTIPAKAKPFFALVPRLRAACRQIDGLVKEIEALGDAGLKRLLHVQSITTHLKSAKKGIWDGRPSHVCPYCKGKKATCEACKGEGWVTAGMYGRCPRETKDQR